MDKMDLLVKDLVSWLKVHVEGAGGKGLVFGLSGGVDSAVMAAISKLAFPDTSLGIIMPCYSDPRDKEDALLVADALDLKTQVVDLGPVFDIFIKQLKLQKSKLAEANLKPRLRMSTLYYYAQNLNYLVAGPTNKSEFHVGYFTKHGDSGVDLLPLANIVKEDIWNMARYLKVPEPIIEKTPTAGLWEDQSDEEEMGFSYKLLDKFLRTGKGPENIIEKIDKMNITSSHKRKFPPIYKYHNLVD